MPFDSNAFSSLCGRANRRNAVSERSASAALSARSGAPAVAGSIVGAGDGPLEPKKRDRIQRALERSAVLPSTVIDTLPARWLHIWASD
jgi:hypothetical protein